MVTAFSQSFRTVATQFSVDNSMNPYEGGTCEALIE